MTANKRFKRRVRERAQRTGESYTAALRHLRNRESEEAAMEWQRIEKPEYGYAIGLPVGWTEQPPDLRNSPLETARFVDPEDRRHSLIVFRSMPALGTTARRLADGTQRVLELKGWLDLSVTEATFGGATGIRLDAVKRDAGREMAIRQYFVAVGEVGLILASNTIAPDEDDALLTEISVRFEILVD